jgi:hypothetical protein
MGPMAPLPRRLAVMAIAATLGLGALAGCGGDNPYQAAESANTVATTTNADIGDNDFLPEDENLSSCIGTLQRPDCGSKSKGGWRMYLTFAVLMSGMAFIGWRITKGVRARDRVVNAPANAPTNAPAEEPADR